jgi:hypothetical protein
VLQPNKYDPDRAHVAVYNGAKAKEVAVDVSTFLKRGERYRIVRALDLYGQPVAAGVCEGDAMRVPVNGVFEALVILKGD